jgi:hypothetical protein
MVKCVHCKEEIGLSEKCYTLLDKEDKMAIHDKCIEDYRKKDLIKLRKK